MFILARHMARIVVGGDCGVTWWLHKTDGGWALTADGRAGRIVSTTMIPQEIAWRIFTKARSRAAEVSIEGDARIGRGAVGLTPIVG
jgi:hypothetical protein